MSILAINGKIGSGKDTVGSMIRYLTSGCADPAGKVYRTYDEFMQKGQGNNDFQTWYNSDWEVKKFADKLKQVAELLTGIPKYKFENQEFKQTTLGPEWNYPIHETYDGRVTKQMTVRELLQKLGTEAMREGLHTDVWVNALMADYYCLDDSGRVSMGNIIDYSNCEFPKWIITDLRFPNELKSVLDRQGITIRVTRPGTARGTHASETALDSYPFKYEISNDGSIDDLLDKVRQILVSEKIIS